MAAAPTVTTFNTPLTNCSFALLAGPTAGGDAVMLIANATLLTGAQTSGPLFDFLNGTYANAAAVNTAFRNVLGEIDVRVSATTVQSSTSLLVEWIATASKPALQITETTATDSVYEILLRVSHTIIR